MNSINYNCKDKFYFEHVRNEIVELVPVGKNRVLEIGCGAGVTLVELKNTGRASEIAGVDVVELGQGRVLNWFVNADIEKIELPFTAGYFDVIICADVLEHLVDPWEALKGLKRYIKDDGVFILSLPNIRELRALCGIIKGDFAYTSSGVMDKTHLRFFARQNILELVNYAGLSVERIDAMLTPRRAWLNRLILGLFEGFLAEQYIVVVRKAKVVV